MCLDTKTDAIEVLTQPVILKLDASIRIGLRRCFSYQWFDRLEFMSDPCQCRLFTIRIGNNKLCRQYSAEQS